MAARHYGVGGGGNSGGVDMGVNYNARSRLVVDAVGTVSSSTACRHAVKRVAKGRIAAATDRVTLKISHGAISAVSIYAIFRIFYRMIL